MNPGKAAFLSIVSICVSFVVCNFHKDYLEFKQQSVGPVPLVPYGVVDMVQWVPETQGIEVGTKYDTDANFWWQCEGKNVVRLANGWRCDDGGDRDISSFPYSPNAPAECDTRPDDVDEVMRMAYPDYHPGTVHCFAEPMHITPQESAWKR